MFLTSICYIQNQVAKILTQYKTKLYYLNYVGGKYGSVVICVSFNSIFNFCCWRYNEFLFGKHDPTDLVLLIFIISLIATIFYMVIVINREIKKD